MITLGSRLVSPFLLLCLASGWFAAGCADSTKNSGESDAGSGSGGATAGASGASGGAGGGGGGGAGTGATAGRGGMAGGSSGSGGAAAGGAAGGAGAPGGRGGAAGAAAGASGSGGAAGTGVDGGMASSDGGRVDTGSSGGPLLPANATKFAAENKGGGFVAQPPAGSTCPVGAALYTVTIVTKAFTYHECVTGTMDRLEPFKWKDGQRTLTDPELASLTAAFGKVTVATRVICGADKPVLTLTVTTPAAETEYLDSFYSCQKKGIYVDNIDAVFAAFRLLPRP